jgi:hypothetical protein
MVRSFLHPPRVTQVNHLCPVVRPARLGKPHRGTGDRTIPYHSSGHSGANPCKNPGRRAGISPKRVAGRRSSHSGGGLPPNTVRILAKPMCVRVSSPAMAHQAATGGRARSKNRAILKVVPTRPAVAALCGNLTPPREGLARKGQQGGQGQEQFHRSHHDRMQRRRVGADHSLGGPAAWEFPAVAGPPPGRLARQRRGLCLLIEQVGGRRGYSGGRLGGGRNVGRPAQRREDQDQPSDPNQFPPPKGRLEGTVPISVAGGRLEGTVPISVAGGHRNGTVPFCPPVDTEIRTAST